MYIKKLIVWLTIFAATLVSGVLAYSLYGLYIYGDTDVLGIILLVISALSLIPVFYYTYFDKNDKKV